MANGFDNEKEFIQKLNNQPFNTLNKNLQSLVLKINNNIIPNIILARRYAGVNKADIEINLDGKSYLISIKKGSGNSVHQEPVEGFISYLSENFTQDQSVFNDIRHFIWGDNSLDGKGNKQDRISANEYKKRFTEKLENIQRYLNSHKKELLTRFLITGSKSSLPADYILYGNINNCYIVHKDKILAFASTHSKSIPSIGVLSLQAWNRNLNLGDKSEHKRGQIQLKWGTLEQDIKRL